MKIQYITKRDESVVTFDSNLITNAIFKAAKSVGGDDFQTAINLSDLVISIIEKDYQNKPVTVEKVQDIVEKILIKEGHAKTAKAYILYRYNRNKIREEKRQEILDQINKHEAQIILEDGSSVLFDSEKMLFNLENMANDLKDINCEALFLESCSNLYNGIRKKELEIALINSAKSRIEVSINYSFLAARLILEQLYHKILNSTFIPKNDNLEKIYQESFSTYIEKGLANELLDSRLKEFDLNLLQQNISPERDLLFQYRGLQTLHDRYLLKTIENKQQVFELPQYFWMRVAMGLALAEKGNKTERAIEFYNSISQLDYIPSTPTLFNAGTNYPQLSSCFLNTASDSLEGIFKSYADNAKLSKFAGGIGTDWTYVRSLGSRIKGTNGNSQGIIPFLKIFNDIAVAVNQGGKRKGAMCAYLEIWHGDVEEFLESKKNTGDERRRLHDVHTALWIPDLFMKRLENNEHWTLFSPSDVPDLHDLYGASFEKKYVEYEKKELPSAKKISAQFLWKKTITMLFETGHPWITFKDACNLRNPQDHAGVIHNSNLCTEITLNNSETETAVCNLGSLNLAKMVNNGKIDEEKLKNTAIKAIRMLDNVIDINYYPTVEAKNSNSRHRPVGLGIMGYQDALFQLNIPFGSQEQVDFADKLMEKISYYAIQGSAELARERGSYSSFKGSKWDRGLLPLDTYKILDQARGKLLEYNANSTMDWDYLKNIIKQTGMRNSNCLAIAPTATISNIAGNTPCVEPIFRNIYNKENTDGSFIVVNHYLMDDLKKLNLWSKEIINKIKYYDGSVTELDEIPQWIKDKYQGVFEIDTQWLLKGAARRSKWIDQSQSLNIFTSSTSGQFLSDVYQTAWKLGLKTTYYLRSLSISQIEKNIEIKNQTKEELNKKPAKIDEITCEACQ